MERIIFTLDNGKEYILSRGVYGREEPMKDRVSASTQLSLATEKLRYFTTDDGTIIFSEHIASAKIESF